VAYSYVRFSSPEQARGDSLRRQQDLRDRWLAKSGAVLDTSLSLTDAGVSAFRGRHRDNPDRAALAGFLELVRRGRVPRGSFLIVESLDRLSREHIRPALTLLLNLIEAGVRVVQLLPAEAIYDDTAEPMTLMMAIMELSRGHSESKMKSERNAASWAAARAEAGARLISPACPAWLRAEGRRAVGKHVRYGRFAVDRDKAEAVREVYRLAAAGYGLGAIAKRLNAAKVPPIGRGRLWVRGYVNKLLKSRAVVGEFQPMTGRRAGDERPAGPPLANYYPAIMTEDEWHAAQAALSSRKRKGGRPPRQGGVNLWAGLLHDARDGGTLHVADKSHHRTGGGPVLVSYNADQGAAGAKAVSFPLAAFERAVLSRLREIDPREILPDTGGAADRVLTLTGRLAEVEARLAQVQAKIEGDGGDLDVLVKAARSLSDKREGLTAELAEAGREAASPLASAWGEYGSLVDVLDAAADPADTRLRLRAALRRMVTGIWCLFVGRGRWRVAAVQFHFDGGARRDYLLLHRPAHGNPSSRRDAQTLARSFAAADANGLDLRKKKDALDLEKTLQKWDPAELSGDAL
jgi:DNA invertase Pin-like site-specific DNA recombinase